MVREPITEKAICRYDGNSLCMDCIEITDFETNEVICQKCGIVLQDKILQDNKVSNGNTANTETHVKNRSLRFHDMGLATVIGKFNCDSKGKLLDYKTRQAMNRMRLWDSRSQTKNTSERNLRVALSEIEKLKEKLGLSDSVGERSSYLYRKAVKSQLIRGRSIKGIVGACMYVACREMNATRTIKDISNNLQESRSSIARNYRMLFHHLRLTTSIQDPVKCIVKIANNLEIPENTKREAMNIFDILKEKKLTAGKRPDAVAATVIYMAIIKTGVNLSQQNISKVAGITVVTIRNRYQEYIQHVKLF
ncbi:MAG: transcription initiation factor IIB [Nitrosopumilus sp.]|nr:transcription initiation factor IIB [Nitrosopumilus sp.]MDH3487731.1 transcription initiation factor IIB [Nitrosopumilus sp.]